MAQANRIRIVHSLVLMLCLESAGAAENLPAPIAACLKKGAGYAISYKIDPSTLRGDFDGDGKPDVAVLVTRGRNQGIVVCRGGGAAPTVLGAGTPFNDMKDLDFSVWRLHRAGRRVARGAGVGRPPALAGDALYLEWESASAIVFWNGKRFAWYQQGD